MRTALIYCLVLVFLALATPAYAAEKTIALTFDDGPYGTSTLEILAILQKEHVHATFFLIGKRVEQYPDIAREIVNDGNAVGNHSYDHSMHLTKLASKDFATNLFKAEAAIASTTGIKTKLFRPPYGLLSTTMRSVLKKYNFRIELWNDDPEDWNYPSSTPEKIITVAEKEARPGGIIILHDGRDTHDNYPRDNTLEALPKLIEDLKAQGYTFVTLGQ